MVEFDWNISGTRAEFLAEIVNSTRRMHFIVRNYAESNSVDYTEELIMYKNVLRSQIFEVRGHVLDTDSVDNKRIETVVNDFTDLDETDFSRKQLLKDLENIDQRLQEIRIDLGLDIGKTEEEELGPTDLYEA